LPACSTRSPSFAPRARRATRPTISPIAPSASSPPHAVAVAIDRFVEPIPKAPGDRVTGAVHIDATICVERQGQKRILIGTGGEMLKRIGTRARLRIQELTGRKVNLKLWVRVAPAWRQSREKLDELGYSVHGEAAAIVELPEEAMEEEGAS
jgi:hypothetical protein